MEGIRINKYISDSGFCSRREADKLIEELDVEINGKTANILSRVLPGDKVKVSGRYIKYEDVEKKRIYIAFNKPIGVVSTTDLQEKNNIVSYINHRERIFNIGRLDKMSEGLIFLTNDGDIVNKILRAGNNHEKEYIVSVDKPIGEEFIQKMSGGVRIMGIKTDPCKVTQLKEDTFKIILTQGLNRQIRKMCSKLGYKVTKLKRVRIMNIPLGGLKVGEWRYFTEKEVEQIQEMTRSSKKTASRSISRRPKTFTTPTKTRSTNSNKSSKKSYSRSK